MSPLFETESVHYSQSMSVIAAGSEGEVGGGVGTCGHGFTNTCSHFCQPVPRWRLTYEDITFGNICLSYEREIFRVNLGDKIGMVSGLSANIF